LLADEIFNKRPEQLSVEQFVELTNRVEKELEGQKGIEK
jgi:16S rRNA (adenine1518-N6/adenine1519-N6)-dimethyltransferase